MARDLGLPNITVIFKGLAATAIARSERGIVAVLLVDDTEGGAAYNEYKSVIDIDFEHWSADNYDALKLIFAGVPSKVIAIRQKTAEKNVADALKKLKDLRWNYFCYPGIAAADKTIVTSWIKEMREQHYKTFKAVLPSEAADHEGIINYTTDKVASTVTGKTHTAAQYCARIAGLLAGLSLSRSSTYYALTDVTSAEVPEDPDDRINKGELILVYDGEKYKIGRGVNSLVSFTAEKTEDVAKIKIVEGMDLYQDDIRSTFADSYVGKYINDYDNKQMFVGAVRTYQKGLEGDVLDKSYENTASIDAEGQHSYLEGRGQDTSAMTETQILMANTGSQVYLSSDVKFVDAMEDLTMTVHM